MSEDVQKLYGRREQYLACARAIVRDPDDAEDAVQNAFLRVLSSNGFLKAGPGVMEGIVHAEAEKIVQMRKEKPKSVPDVSSNARLPDIGEPSARQYDFSSLIEELELE